jgi:uncharacterized protein involved in cysteine biosynthesis
MGQILKAFSAIANSIFSTHYGFLRYILVSSLLSILIIFGLTYGGHELTEKIGQYMVDMIPGEWKHTEVVVNILSWLIAIILLFLLVKHIVLIVLSPVLSHIVASMLGESVGKSPSMIQSITRAIKVNGHFIVKEIGLTILFFGLSFLPVVGFLGLICLFAVQFYYAGCGLFDYYLELKYNFADTLVKCRQNKWAAMLIGAFFMIGLVIPFVGVIIAPYFGVRAAVSYFKES